MGRPDTPPNPPLAVNPPSVPPKLQTTLEGDLKQAEAILKFGAEHGFHRHIQKRIIQWNRGERELELSFPDEVEDGKVLVTVTVPVKLSELSIADGKLVLADAVLRELKGHPVIG